MSSSRRCPWGMRVTTPETRARLRTLEQQLAAPTPAALDGQAAIPVTWQQEPLWEPARPQEPPPCRSRHTAAKPAHTPSLATPSPQPSPRSAKRPDPPRAPTAGT